MPSATIKLFLVHGDPKRLRTAEISNWSGKAIAAPRTELEELLGRPEVAQSGVYLLTGSDLATGGPLAYMGEGEVLRDRLKAHSSREFWVQAFAFVSKDENLTKSHIRYLEGRLIEDSKKSARFRLENQQASGAKLPESDREDMEVFLDKIRQLLPVLGSEILTRVPTYAASGRKAHLLCEIKGVVAKGQRTPSGFVVFKGSQAVLKTRPSAKKWPYVLNAREKLLQDGSLVEEESFLRFTRDVEFASPSGAASVIQGGTANGLIAWKNRSGKTLKDLERD